VTATKIVTKDGVQGGGPLGLAALKRLLSGGGDQRQVTDAVHALSDAELMQFGLRAFHMNLLSLFGQTRPPEEIARTARAAAISKILGGWEYHHHYLPRLSTTPDRPRISDLPIGEIKDILSRGRGLVVVSFHLGPMRYLPSDLAHAGVPTCIPLATDAFGDYASARAANPGAALDGLQDRQRRGGRGRGDPRQGIGGRRVRRVSSGWQYRTGRAEGRP
jgi:hypothetical protein